MVSAATIVGVLVNPKSPAAEFSLHELNEPARALSRQLVVENTGSEQDIDIRHLSILPSTASLPIRSGCHPANRS